MALWYILFSHNPRRHAIRCEFPCILHPIIAGAESRQYLEVRFAPGSPRCESLYAREVLHARMSVFPLQVPFVISDIRTFTVLTFNSKVASSSATIVDRGCCCKHERVHIWLTAPSIAFCKATALLAPVAMMTTSLACCFPCQYIVTDRNKLTPLDG